MLDIEIQIAELEDKIEQLLDSTDLDETLLGILYDKLDEMYVNKYNGMYIIE